MRMPAAADLQRWSEEVARDPSSLAFIPLAEAYRRQGQRDAALRLCLRGLERHPTHVEAHTLLARIYLDAGQIDKACDEWAMVLRLDADNFEANRGMGFTLLSRKEHAAARRHLEKAAALRPADAAVREALTVLRRREASGDVLAAPGASARGAAPAAAPAAPPVRDPTRLFEPFLAETLFLGAVVLDAQGLVLAATLSGGDGSGRAEAVGAILGEAIDEAARTTGQLALGQWKGIMLETDRAVIHLSPLAQGVIVLLAARREAPAGWVVRTATQASDLARRFLESAP